MHGRCILVQQCCFLTPALFLSVTVNRSGCKAIGSSFALLAVIELHSKVGHASEQAFVLVSALCTARDMVSCLETQLSIPQPAVHESPSLYKEFLQVCIPDGCNFRQLSWHSLCRYWMQLVPAVSELIVAELLYLQYQDRTKPLYMYINSTGTSRADGETVRPLTGASKLLIQGVFPCTPGLLATNFDLQCSSALPTTKLSTC